MDALVPKAFFTLLLASHARGGSRNGAALWAIPAQAYASASHGEYDARSGLLRTYDRTAVVFADTRPRVRGVAVPSGLRRAAAHQIDAGIHVRHVLHLAAHTPAPRRAASWLRRAAVQAERWLLGYAMKLTQRRICDKPTTGPMRRLSLPSGQFHGGPRAALSAPANTSIASARCSRKRRWRRSRLRRHSCASHSAHAIRAMRPKQQRAAGFSLWSKRVH